MNGQRLSLLALAGVVVLAAAVSAQSKPAAKAPATTTAPAQQPAAPARLVPPVRGDVKVNITKPMVKRQGEFIITTMKVKNMMEGSIAGLKVDEYWYDKKGDPVTGSTFRYPKPLQPGEVIEITLKTHVDPKMDRNQYQFTQANGAVKPTTVPKL
jgi:hypothetical protein